MMLRRSQSAIDFKDKTKIDECTDNKNSSTPIIMQKKSAVLEDDSLPEDNQNSTEHFNKNHDDSSDEEEVEDSLNQFNIGLNWQAKLDQKASTINKVFSINNDDLLSFIAHAAGIKLFYSKEINSAYYPLKDKLLKQKLTDSSAVVQLQELIKNAAMQSLHLALESAQRFIHLAGQNNSVQQQFDINREKILTRFSKECDELIPTQIKHFINWLSLQSLSSNKKPPAEIDEFIKTISAKLITILSAEYKIQNILNNRMVDKENIFQLAKDHMIHISRILGFHVRENLLGKNEAILHLDKHKTDYKNFVVLIKQILHTSPARGYVHNTLQKYFDELSVKNECVRLYLEDLISIMNIKDKQKKLSLSVKKIYNNYFKANNENVCDEIILHFNAYLNQKLAVAIKQYYRPTLGNNYFFESHNAYQFFANLRLSNRSQKRQIKNLSNSIFTGNRISRGWRLCENFTDNTDVVETQEILSTSLGRKDMVESLGNYAKVYDTIKQIQNCLNANNIESSDRTLAEWIRAIFNGQPLNLALPQIDRLSIIHKLQAISYLLFGCEATRNTAMHVVNQMLLDLIIEGSDWNFSQSFTGKGGSVQAGNFSMPMIPEGAVATSRALESNYRKFMPYAYYYRGIEDKDTKDTSYKITDLVKFEAKIIRDWLKLKNPNLGRIRSNKLPQLILDSVENNYGHWFTNSEKVSEEALLEKMQSLKF